MTPVGELAESWQTSPDGLTWTFKLRQGVKFHDGQELTSADVKFTFDRLFEKSPGKSDFIAVDKVEPVGKYQVKFVTKEPFAGLLAALGGFWGFIINEAGRQEARRPQQGRGRHRPLHAGRLEGRAADDAQEARGLLQEGAAVRRPGRPAHHPRRGQHRGRAADGPDPPRVHRGQQELQPAQGGEVADRLSLLAAGLRLPQHQRQPGPAQGRARAAGHLVCGGPRPGHARGRLRLRPAHRAGHRAR